MNAEDMLDVLYALAWLGALLAIPVTAMTRPQSRAQLMQRWQDSPFRFLARLAVNGVLMALMVGFLGWAVWGTLRG